jgi:hypothetical protein
MKYCTVKFICNFDSTISSEIIVSTYSVTICGHKEYLIMS